MFTDIQMTARFLFIYKEGEGSDVNYELIGAELSRDFSMPGLLYSVISLDFPGAVKGTDY